MKNDILPKLISAFIAAREAGEAADREDDGGTCNFDSPAFRIKGVRDSLIQDAAQRANVTAIEFAWFGGRRWYHLGGDWMQGFANRRARISDAANSALEKAAESIPGMTVCHYQQMD